MKAALLQLRVCDGETSADRWLRVEQMLAGMQGKSIDFIMLPELWGVGFCNYDRYVQAAEPLQGQTVFRLAEWARRLHCYIVTGSFVECTPDGKRYNTTAMLDTDGNLIASYRKIHLFGYDSQERVLLTPGTDIQQADTRYGIVGLSTCYDLRFPEQFRRMVDNGAALFAVTAAWPQQRLQDWQLFCRVRALENQSFLLACNHAGSCGGTVGAGHSMIVAPDGMVLAEAGAEEQVLMAELDLDAVQRFRRQFPALHDRVEIE